MTKLVWYFESSVVRLSACMAKYNDNKIIEMNIKVDKGQTYKHAKFIFLVRLFKHSTLIKKNSYKHLSKFTGQTIYCYLNQ